MVNLGDEVETHRELANPNLKSNLLRAHHSRDDDRSFGNFISASSSLFNCSLPSHLSGVRADLSPSTAGDLVEGSGLER